ncbi:hypothetical protein SPAN111604_15070 [Sphingomonas antarctica]
MRSGIVIDLTSADRERLERIGKDRNAPQKHVWRAEIVLLSADGVGTSGIMRRTDTSKTCVWRWQERFMQEGVEGLLRDKTGPVRYFVREAGCVCQMTNLSPKITANWLFASPHSRWSFPFVRRVVEHEV